MKKIYLLGLASMCALAVNAQTTFKVKNPLKKNNPTASDAKLVSGKKANTSKSIGSNSVQQVVATITCNTPYVAGTTMDLNMSYQSSNTDQEYVDFLEITFPAGITPTGAGTTSNPFPNTADPAGGLEALNAPVGQVISWGVDNDDQYGGIFAPTAINFVVEVTIAPGTTGTQTASFTASGDTYGATPGNQGATSFQIVEQQPVNMKAIEAAFLDLTTSSVVSSGCGLTSANVVVLATNNGSTAITVPTLGDVLTYTVNGTPTSVPVTAVVDFNTGNPVSSIAPGDTVIIADITNSVDLSTAGSYSLDAAISFAGSSDANASDDAAANVTIVHLAPVNIDATTYNEGFETGGVAGANFVGEDVDAGGFNIFDTPTGNAGSAAALWFFENNTANAASDDWAFSTCLDFTAGSMYYVKCFARLTTGYEGTLSYALSSDQTSAGVTQTIGTNTTLTANSTYTMDSVAFTANATGTFYLGLHAVNSNAATTNGLSIRVDDISVGLVSPVGIKTNATAEVVSIFPNPNAGVFTVKATENNSSVAVYSIIGENVYSSKLVKGNNSIDLTNLAAGSYVVKVNNGGTLVTKRVVINK